MKVGRDIEPLRGPFEEGMLSGPDRRPTETYIANEDADPVGKWLSY